jgi:small-conductance mechanosensitive channel/CRP-like cAMP-binding protein
MATPVYKIRFLTILSALIVLLCHLLLFFGSAISPDTLATGGWLTKALWTVAGLCTAHLVNRGIDVLIWDRLVAKSLGGTVPAILKTMVAVVVYLVAMSMIVGLVYEQNVAAFLTALGAGGVVLGLAVRGIFSDLFTGLAVNLDGNVVIDDWIQLASRSAQARPLLGRVQEIGWRSTQLETEDGTLLIIPNTVIAEDLVTNFTRPTKATRSECTIDLDPSVPCQRGKRILLGAARSLVGNRGFVAEKEPAVLINGTSERGVQYLIRFWIQPWNPLSPTTARDAVLTRALEHLAVAGLEPARGKTEVFHDRIAVRRPPDTTAEGRAQMLAGVHLFASLEDDDRMQLAADLKRLVLPPQETVVAQGDTGDTLYIIAEGALDVILNTDQSPDPVRVATLGAGDFFGEMSLLTGEPRRATVRAATPAVLYELSRDTVADLIERRPDVADVLSRAVAERKVGLDAAHRNTGHAAKEAAVSTLSSQVSRLVKDFFSRRIRSSPTVAS